jgi:hypothetical protein
MNEQHQPIDATRNALPRPSRYLGGQAVAGTAIPSACRTERSLDTAAPEAGAQAPVQKPDYEVNHVRGKMWFPQDLDSRDVIWWS